MQAAAVIQTAKRKTTHAIRNHRFNLNNLILKRYFCEYDLKHCKKFDRRLFLFFKATFGGRSHKL
jgi:hypothetical protein